MPMTLADAEREIGVLKNIVAGLMRTNATLTTRIDALEKRGADLERLIAGINQFGSMFAGLAQNQTAVKNPAKKWEPV